MDENRKSNFERLPFMNMPEADPSLIEAKKPTALVHILTPEFHGLDPADFANIPDDVLARATADELQPSLYWIYKPKSERERPDTPSFSYFSAYGEIISVALTPEEYNSAVESIDKLAERSLSRVLTQRDNALRLETGDKNARARGVEDMRVARRGAMRAVIDSQVTMQTLLDESILPKIDLIERFIEMTEAKNPNLARGSRQAVSQRFEELRTTVFDDMLDAIGIKRNWSPELAEKAKRVIQKRLYMSGSPKERVANFRAMVALAHEYYGHKRALLLTKIEDARRYQRRNPEVVQDIEIVDQSRQ